MMENWNRIFTGMITTFYTTQLDPLGGAITSGRARALVAVAVGLISVVIGGVVRARSTSHTASGRVGPIVALTLGLIAMALSVIHLGMSTGGFGTGSGRAGAIVALVLGLIGLGLGGLTLARSPRAHNTD